MSPAAPARVLVVTAVNTERDAAAATLSTAESVLGPYPSLTATTAIGRVDVIAGGVGCANSATAAASALAGAPYSLVLSAGVGGGFGPATPGTSVLASAVVHADLGAESADGFLPADEIGLASTRTVLPADLVAQLADHTSAGIGTVLTVSTVTGTAATAAALLARFPDARAEAMEGAGVLAAAQAYQVPFAELRAISNVVGPRDRGAWQLDAALAELSRAVGALCSHPVRAA